MGGIDFFFIKLVSVITNVCEDLILSCQSVWKRKGNLKEKEKFREVK